MSSSRREPIPGPIVILTGGTGGAKLARGLLDVVAPDGLTAVANPGDDIEIYGAYVAPDADLVTFWLADRIDPRGWGLDGDTFAVMDGLRELGVDVWFNLGDRDLAYGVHRAGVLARGGSLTDAHAEIVHALGVAAEVLPASDRPVRTQVMTGGRWRGFQQFMIQERGEGEVQDVAFHGLATATPTRQVLQAIAAARAIIIGPSNPVASIAPILELPGMRDALRQAAAPVVAVSPLVRGQVVKGPTAAFMAHAGRPLSSEGIAEHYAGVIDGLVSDEPTDRVPVLQTDMLMDTPPARARLAEETVRFALSLGARA